MMAWTLISGLMALLVCSVTSADVPCPSWQNAVTVEGKCMKFIDFPLGWFDAQIHCEQQHGGGRLVELNSLAELNGAKILAGGRGVAIGGTEFSNRVWKWWSGADLEPSLPWNLFQPNNLFGRENCLELDLFGKLNDYPCTDKRPFICEPAPPKPTPISSCKMSPDSAEVDGKCITFIGNPKTWHDARRHCEQQPGGGRLVEPMTPDEWNKARQLSNGQEVWIGGVQVSERKWKWASGGFLGTFVTWALFQPDYLLGKEDCLELNKKGDLNDHECLQEHFFICETTLGKPEPEQTVKPTHHLELFDTPMSWKDARTFCRNLGQGADLVALETKEEFDKVVTMAAGTKVWTGGYKDKNGKWLWSSGGGISNNVVEWSAGQPDNETGNEDCVELMTGGKLNDRDCEPKRPFICQRE